ncbi:hypothetical protein LNKW23_07520 [Paralimibaculum aggregatum]|uniref:Small-conductance mechanosensitive channel n=1 Tax=Paralimibaculum aggregatum TaxID=3036245 RepID=A0ABQ6LLJ7_9RHOB|nr:mechanosensitive ion channel family protein [Limibaculum sp. NKW23]GMG81539.1 hypothetical protein LNKW23_07520 [Limibaculum sp. NKW23]
MSVSVLVLAAASSAAGPAAAGPAAGSAAPAGGAAPVPAAAQGLSAVAELENALAGAFAAAGDLPASLAEAFGALPENALVLILFALAAAYGVERLVRLLLARAEIMTPPASFAERLSRGGRWFAGRLLSLAVFALAARLIGRSILMPDPHVAALGFGLLHALIFARFIWAVIEALAGPGAPGRRLMGFTDAEAQHIGRDARVLVGLVGAAVVLRAVLVAMVGPVSEAVLGLLAVVLLNAAAGIWFFLRLRAPISALIDRQAGDEPHAGWRALLARNWVWLFVAAYALDAEMKAAGVLGLLGEAARESNGAGPVILLLALATLAVAGLRVWRSEIEATRPSGWTVGAAVLAEGLIVILAAVLLLRFWGLDPLAPEEGDGIGRIVSGVVEAGVVLAAGIAAWQVLTVLLRSSGETPDEDDAGGDGMGAEGSRIETVLPILRRFGLTVVAIVTGMTALAALGVNIGPLIASAGVVGLAVGFGAQKLVSDVISGAFYLYEDAFRIGEYIVTESGKGMVERISMRSATLRHHNGPIYTIPFSSMGTIQNHSRDYVVMKFSFLVPDDTDVEMVRKLVKKAGAELAEDPELEGKLISPLKSQGAISIQGRSFEIGCKFTARPGQQFVIRRKAYAVLQKALREKGVELFAPQLLLNTEGLTGQGGLPSGGAPGAQSSP